MIILGLNISHNASACLLYGGKIIGCVSEERFTRIKNNFGYPAKSIAYLLKTFSLKSSDINYVVNAGLTSMSIWTPEIKDKKNIWKAINYLLDYTPLIPFLDHLSRKIYYLYLKIFSPQDIYQTISSKLNVEKKKILLASHHRCHAYAAFYGFAPNTNRSNMVILTQDAQGDSLCGSISVFRNNQVQCIADIPAGNSIAALYTNVTSILGMKMYEHEYKVMGLAPYSANHEVKKVIPIFNGLVRVIDLDIKTRFGGVFSFIYLKKALFGKRFDGIAGAIQTLTEEKITEWVRNIIAKTEANNIIVGGGLFMNVKLNQKLAEMKEVKELIVCPSAGDESNAIGAAYWGYEYYCNKHNLKFTPQPIVNLYLGPEFSDKEIYNELKILKGKVNYKITKVANIEKKIAELLSRNAIVARFSGKMEFGARALGNRSILANPMNSSTIRVINEQIKNRDYWMPFSPTVLHRRSDDYLVNPKRNKSPFMTFTFNTTELGKKKLKAAIHPYDFTARAQILERQTNPSYYKLIEEFEKLTGVGAVLNTSFNLHGEPIVCSPKDALHTFKNSGLKNLALGSYLIQKTDKA